MKLKSTPFDVPLPTPSHLAANNAGDFSPSLPADKLQIVPVAAFEVADTNVWLCVLSLHGPSMGCMAGTWDTATQTLGTALGLPHFWVP